MKKKVLMICYHYPPCASSGVFRNIRFLKNLPDYNWMPVTLTIAPEYYYNDPLDFNLINNYKSLNEIPIHRTKAFIGIDKIISFIKKCLKGCRNTPNSDKQTNSVRNNKNVDLFHKFKDAVTLTFMIPDKQNIWIPFAVTEGIRIIKKESPSVLYASGRPWSAFLIGCILKKFSNAPLVIDFRDPWVGNSYDEDDFFLKNRINSFLEKQCMKIADCVIANTEPLRKLFVEKYKTLEPEKFVTLTNGYDESDFKGLSVRNGFKTDGAPFIFTHVGTLYSKRSPEMFLSALASLIRKGVIPKNKVIIRFIGKTEIHNLKNILEKEQIASGVEIIGHIPKKDALQASAESDVLLLIQPDTALQIPAKLFEYIRLGKPIFAVCGEGATKEIINSNKFGLVAKYDDIDDIENKLSIMFDLLNKTDMDKTSGAADDAVKQFDSKTLTYQLACIFNRTTNLKGVRP